MRFKLRSSNLAGHLPKINQGFKIMGEFKVICVNNHCRSDDGLYECWSVPSKKDKHQLDSFCRNHRLPIATRIKGSKGHQGVLQWFAAQQGKYPTPKSFPSFKALGPQLMAGFVLGCESARPPTEEVTVEEEDASDSSVAPDAGIISLPKNESTCRVQPTAFAMSADGEYSLLICPNPEDPENGFGEIGASGEYKTDFSLSGNVAAFNPFFPIHFYHNQ